MLVELAVLTLLAAAGCAPPARPIVTEVFYDAIGDDTGLEFVELWNPASAPYPLAGLRLEAGDGAGPGRWTTRWTGAVTDTLPPLGRFVIGGARVSPAPQVVMELALQNGPDAVRLVWPDGAVEVVGYGALADPEYYCGSPAPDVAAGQSLARVPDGADLGSNARDFRAAAPSPGRANQPGRDLALVRGSLALAPEQPGPGAPATLSGRLVNRGGTAVAADEATLAAGAGGAALGGGRLEVALSPGDTAAFTIALPALPAGKLVIEARLALAGDEEPGNDADSLTARVGPGPLAITEIQFHPAAGLSQTGDPEQGWTAFGLVLGGAERGAGGSIRAIVRRDRAPDPAPGPLGKGVGLEAGAAAWVAAGGGIALWASAPQLRVRGAAPPLRRGLEIGGLWHAPAGGLWLTRRAAPPGASAPADHELGLSLAAGPCAVWGRARDAPLRGGIGVAAQAGVVRAAAEVSSHPVLGETVSLMVMLERRGGGHAPVEPPSVPSSDALP